MTEQPDRYPTSPSFPAPPSGQIPPPNDPGSEATVLPVATASKPRMNWWGTIVTAGVVAVVVSLVVGVGGGLVGYFLGRSADRRAAVPNVSTVAPLPQAPGNTSPRGDNTIAGIVASAMPSVVSIMFEGSSDSGSGSGFVIREDGYILTNNHVVEAAADGGKLEVTFNDGDSVKGTIVGRNAAYDLAVVKVDRTGLAPVTMGNSSAVKVGDAAIAIGEPLGLDGTVTLGIISALDRPVTAGGSGETSYINAIQTDAAINPGNSGGPLLDGSGHVIGVNSAIATMATGGEGGSIGLGFAIPINVAKRLSEEIISTGKASTPIIGVQLNLAYKGEGAEISEVTTGGPSEDAGVLAGDIITKVNDRVINDATELVVAVRSYAPGEEITLTVTRDGESVTIPVTLVAADE